MNDPAPPTRATSLPAGWAGPRWIAHRGAGTLAPENTLAAFRLGASFGWRAYECDVKLSADGVPFLLHDATLTRTVRSPAGAPCPRTVAGRLPWATLSRLDAGAWKGRRWRGEPLPTLEAVAAWCLDGGHELNLELKPTPGDEARTGHLVARAARRHWAGAVAGGHAHWPLLSSFSPKALAAARAAAPELPRALLLQQFRPDSLDRAAELGCAALVLEHRLLHDAGQVRNLKRLGLQVLVYTVNQPERASTLAAWGVDAIISDAVDRLTPG